MSREWYPLKFRPIYIEKIWGGRSLETFYKRSLPPEKPIGEAWELSDWGDTLSCVTNGDLKDRTLSEVLHLDKAAILGPAFVHLNRFPLLIKLIDARDKLSVQVHPDDAYCAAHDPKQNGKKEAWIILKADPGAEITKGLQPGVTKEQFAAAIEKGDLEKLLRSGTASTGDVFLLEPGDAHALGTGLLIYEVQQTSDATYRVYDYNRLEKGKPRALHIRQALDVLSFGKETPFTQITQPLSDYDGVREILAQTDKFVLERLTVERPAKHPMDGQGFQVMTVLEGNGELRYGRGVPRTMEYLAGETLLLPAALKDLEIDPETRSVFALAWIHPEDAKNLRA